MGLVCGAGWTDKILKDDPFGCDFSECCRKHDECYDAFKEPCRKPRKECDNSFLICMLGASDDPICIIPAILYYETVRAFGWIAY